MILKELVKEAVNVLIDHVRVFFVEEMSQCLDHDGFVEQRYISLETATVNVFLSSR